MRVSTRLLVSAALVALIAWGQIGAARADTALHSLWELHGKHNTVYLLGSIHVLRPGDYPLAPAVLEAYRNSKSLLMEINLDEINSEQAQSEMLASALLPEGKSLPQILGQSRYSRAESLAHDVGFELSGFDQFAPWFAAEAISQLQLAQLGFEAQSGVEALELFLSERFDVALLDMRMPEMDGLQLLESVRDRDVMAPVVSPVIPASSPAVSGPFNSSRSMHL